MRVHGGLSQSGEASRSAELGRHGNRQEASILPKTVPPHRLALINAAETATATSRSHFAKGGR